MGGVRCGAKAEKETDERVKKEYYSKVRGVPNSLSPLIVYQSVCVFISGVEIHGQSLQRRNRFGLLQFE